MYATTSRDCVWRSNILFETDICMCRFSKIKCCMLGTLNAPWNPHKHGGLVFRRFREYFLHMNVLNFWLPGYEWVLQFLYMWRKKSMVECKVILEYVVSLIQDTDFHLHCVCQPTVIKMESTYNRLILRWPVLHNIFFLLKYEKVKIN